MTELAICAPFLFALSCLGVVLCLVERVGVRVGLIADDEGEGA